VDTPGFMPGTKEESRGVIRLGAGLVRAFAGATVPKVTVVLRKAFGGAFITMNSRGLGADLVLAWPGAEVGVMAPGQAVGVMHSRALAEAPDPAALRAELAAAYAVEHTSIGVAAAHGFIDEVIDPAHTRDRVARAFAALGTRRRAR
jgi:acetyl-CoA carboxylase carboxyltransferase component